MNAYPISEMVNMPGVNDPSMLNPVGEKLLKEINQNPLLMGRQFHKEKSRTDRQWFQSHKESGPPT